MADSRERKFGRAWLFGLAAAAGIVAGLGAVYFSGGLPGNGDSAVAADCAPAIAAGKRLAPLAKGEVAAFRIAERPEKLADLAFKTPEGADTSLAAFAGRPVLVNLWATWCVPCRTEMPALDRLQAAMGGKGFDVVAVNIDLKNPERAKAFLADIDVRNLAFYSDPTTQIFAGLKSRGLAFGLPATFLIDGKGCRIGGIDGPAAWDSEDARALIGAATAAS